MDSSMIIEQPTTIRTAAYTLVTRWDFDDGPTYILEFPDAGVSARLTEAQVRALGARILTATMANDDDLEAMTAADDAA